MRKTLYIALGAVCLWNCGKKEPVVSGTKIEDEYSFDLQGHRGARGLAPENTLVAFQKALDLGVNTLEMDVVVSKDKQVVVSHEPWFNPVLTLTLDSEEMEDTGKPTTNFFQMQYSDIRKYDCGSRKHPNFPKQENEKAYKPLLKEVLRDIEQARKAKGVNLHYNIEIKSMPQGDKLFHPEPEAYVDLVVAAIQKELPEENFNIQSFDFRILRMLRTKYPEIALAALVEKGPLEEHLQQLGFIPDIYSPNYNLVDSALVAVSHDRAIQIIPWTVNDYKEMKRLLQLGVDGLITDYPDRALCLRK